MRKLSEKKKGDGIFECGIKRCGASFVTALGYAYHLNATHAFKIDTPNKCRTFIREFNERVFGDTKGAHGYYVDRFNFATIK